MEPTLIDGGDRSCGELLLIVYAHVRSLPPGALVAIRTTDQAAPIDLPFWCHLTGHDYLGPADPPGRRAGRPDGPGAADTYLIRVATAGRPVNPTRPWHLATTSPETP